MDNVRIVIFLKRGVTSKEGQQKKRNKRFSFIKCKFNKTCCKMNFTEVNISFDGRVTQLENIKLNTLLLNTLYNKIRAS